MIEAALVSCDDHLDLNMLPADVWQKRMAAKWGAPHKLIEVQDVEDSSKHVLAGQAMSPSTTEPVAKLAIDWLRQTL